MKLPILMLNLPSQRFDCHSCVRCCRELVVHLTAEDRRKLDEQGWGGRVEIAPYVRLGSEWVLNQRPGVGCVFLREDNKCRIHAEFGPAAKPVACQLYPFTLNALEGQVFAGIRFDCPSVARSHGSALAAHKQNVRRVSSELESAMPTLFAGARSGVFISSTRSLSTGDLKSLIDALDGWLRNTDRSLTDRLIGLASLTSSLDAARLDRVEDLQDLVAMLIAELPLSLHEFRTASASSPGHRQQELLRQAIFSHCEYLTFEQARASLLSAMAYRWGQLRRARRFIRGTSSLLPFPYARSGGQFEEIAAIGRASDCAATDVDSLMTRYLRARLLGGTVFGPGFYGLSVIEGLESLLLGVAVTGWLSRYTAWTRGNPSFTLEDVIQSLQVVDRTAGRARELGARSARMRVRYLSINHGLARLLTAHALV